MAVGMYVSPHKLTKTFFNVFQRFSYIFLEFRKKIFGPNAWIKKSSNQQGIWKFTNFETLVHCHFLSTVWAVSLITIIFNSKLEKIKILYEKMIFFHKFNFLVQGHELFHIPQIERKFNAIIETAIKGLKKQ